MRAAAVIVANQLALAEMEKAIAVGAEARADWDRAADRRRFRQSGRSWVWRVSLWLKFYRSARQAGFGGSARYHEGCMDSRRMCPHCRAFITSERQSLPVLQ